MKLPDLPTWAWIALGVVALSAAAGGVYIMSKKYAPGSQEAIDLLTAAAVKAGLPASWGANSATHELMRRESGGWVGRPNYTFGGVSSTLRAAEWPQVWARLRAGEVWTKSTATGLGQLLSSNAQKYYPDGRQGIGDPLNEAVGLLRYIADRYGSPQVALAMHGKTGTYIHGITGKARSKGFKEGY